MKHPNPQIQKNQDDFLNQCPEREKGYHAMLFRIGNAAYRYYQLAHSTSNEILELYFQEWLKSLPTNIKADMEKQGIEKCKLMLPFTRYVNERKDIGMDEWMKEHLSEEDYKAYKEEE
jgi:hypothetical protein